MAAIYIEVEIEATADAVWAVVGDWADGPVGMAHGHVLGSHAEGDVRVVTFADGTVVREKLVARDDDTRRIVYSLIETEHDNAVMHIVPTGSGSCRFVWSRDVLPDEAAGHLRMAMAEAVPIIKHTLESGQP